MSLTGRPVRPDVTGRCEYAYHVGIGDGVVNITRSSSPATDKQEPLTLTSGLSELHSLPGSGYQFRVNTTDTTAAWVVRGFLRPQMSLSELENGLKTLGEPYLLELFGVEKIEPYATFWNCTSHPDFAYRLAGFVLAMIYRTEEIRNGR